MQNNKNTILSYDNIICKVDRGCLIRIYTMRNSELGKNILVF